MRAQHLSIGNTRQRQSFADRVDLRMGGTMFSYQDDPKDVQARIERNEQEKVRADNQPERNLATHNPKYIGWLKISEEV